MKQGGRIKYSYMTLREMNKLSAKADIHPSLKRYGYQRMG
jgi:hypothetical protein